jgi:hypothetical protein
MLYVKLNTKNGDLLRICSSTSLSIFAINPANTFQGQLQ